MLHSTGYWPLNAAWLGFARGVNSYANECEDNPSHWGITHSSISFTVPWSCPATSGCVCWLIDWGLNTLILLFSLDPVGFNWFTLSLCAMSFFQRLCSAPFAPVSCSFPEPHLGLQCCLYNLLGENQKIDGPWEGKTV